MSDVKVYIEQSIPETGSITIEDDFIEHYLNNVRRLSHGDRLLVSGLDRVANATIESSDPLMIEIESVRPVVELNHELWIYQAITRKQKFEQTIKRGTELGVTKFVPLVTERTVRVPSNIKKQLRRWKKISMDSARISDRDELPAIETPVELDSLESLDISPVFLADSEGRSTRSVFDESTDETAFVIGPEGGLTDEEKNLLSPLVDDQVSVGQRNLRAETASIAISTIWLDRTENL